MIMIRVIMSHITDLFDLQNTTADDLPSLLATDLRLILNETPNQELETTILSRLSIPRFILLKTLYSSILQATDASFRSGSSSTFSYDQLTAAVSLSSCLVRESYNRVVDIDLDEENDEGNQEEVLSTIETAKDIMSLSIKYLVSSSSLRADPSVHLTDLIEAHHLWITTPPPLLTSEYDIPEAVLKGKDI